ncbi:hypothetical protein [Brevibacillus brevis]|uniref:hypothetical protein n=1 Tax=Brevibacillus brevis TaxID=1393 RepID=UPI000D0E94E1|nr:hypothetical protein [Brevibacillus brevis]PSJ67468.1 hypothetical protein C7J99_20975 [Brevibacillus brevis]RED28457.1 hypothetical protein DES34_108324 [Brevibacillus brevis]GEC90711.1 hypothetical protein BBR01nite_30420 [Brevibacillus brevis]VEF91152.1 Uncharacterised protein [Brevibacillus brevis]
MNKDYVLSKEEIKEILSEHYENYQREREIDSLSFKLFDINFSFKKVKYSPELIGVNVVVEGTTLTYVDIDDFFKIFMPQLNEIWRIEQTNNPTFEKYNYFKECKNKIYEYLKK